MARRHAAAVPASKAKIGTIYAVRRDGELTRFRVNRITTHRVADNGGPADYESEISGVFILGKNDHGIERTEKATIEPHYLLGQFEDYEELVVKKEAEDKAKAAREKVEKRDMADLLELLYRIAGLPMPNSTSDYDAPFRLTSYGGTSPPDIGRKGAKPLLEGLRKLMGEADLAHSANLVDDKVDS